MKISIIMPTYNRAKTIKRAIDSIINQSYTDFELIIVDDGSKDNTNEIVKTIKDKRIKYYYQKNSGACIARNTGIKKASGEYIAFLDSDDEWNNKKLERQIGYLKEKQAKIVFCNYYYEKNNITKIAISDLTKEYLTNNDLLDKNYITTGALLIEKKLIIKQGMFNERMPRYQDWELVLRLTKNNKIYFQNECLLTLHFQEQSISNSTSISKKIIALKELYNNNKKEYDDNKKAYSHIFWSIGLYSLCLNRNDKNSLKIGVYHNGLNIKRLYIYILINIGFKNIIIKKYLKNH